MVSGIDDKLQLKIAKKKKFWESLLLTNLISPHMLLALPKRQIKSAITLLGYKNTRLQSKRPS